MHCWTYGNVETSIIKEKSRVKFCVFAFLLKEAPPSHDILVFLTGQEEIEALARTCRDIAKHLPDTCGPMTVIPLYASLPQAQQFRVFQPAPKVTTDISSTDVITHSFKAKSECTVPLICLLFCTF